jgi:hypothetical protein
MLTLSLGSQQEDITGSAATGSFSTVQVTDSNGRLHTHVGSTIGFDSPEGIYLIGMTVNMPGLEDSKPVYIVYNDLQTLLLSPDPANFARADAIGHTAAGWVQDHVDSIPEPSSLSLATLAAMALAIIVRRRSRKPTPSSQLEDLAPSGACVATSRACALTTDVPGVGGVDD